MNDSSLYRIKYWIRDSIYGERDESRIWIGSLAERSATMDQQRSVDILFRALSEVLDGARRGDWIFAGIDLEINS